jgi:hypothetical protein
VALQVSQIIALDHRAVGTVEFDQDIGQQMGRLLDLGVPELHRLDHLLDGAFEIALIQLRPGMEGRGQEIPVAPVDAARIAVQAILDRHAVRQALEVNRQRVHQLPAFFRRRYFSTI